MFDEIHPENGRNGREGRTALAIAPHVKAILAATGMVVCLGMAGAALLLNLPTWLVVVLVAVGLWALLDVIWQWRKVRRRVHHQSHEQGPTTHGLKVSL